MRNEKKESRHRWQKNCPSHYIKNKVLTMYARCMSQCDITDYVLEEQQSWQNRTLAPFVDYLFVPIKRDYEAKECAVYNILGIRVDGRKEILGIWIQDSESKHAFSIRS